MKHVKRGRIIGDLSGTSIQFFHACDFRIKKLSGENLKTIRFFKCRLDGIVITSDNIKSIRLLHCHRKDNNFEDYVKVHPDCIFLK